MLKKKLLLSSQKKRLLTILLIIASYLSGLGYPWSRTEQSVFVHTTTDREVRSARVFNTALVDEQENRSKPSQIKEIAIGTQAYRQSLSTQSEPTSKSEGGETQKWGVSKQIDEYTWTMRVQHDEKNATVQEILTALNGYRGKKGRGVLSWDTSLAQYAQTRAEYFVSKNTLDSHAGFVDYINNQDGFRKLGFAHLGENSSFGYVLEGVHLIEWVYAGDKPHDDNQLSNDWTHVGIGVSGTATDLVFGGKKM